jgi:hypothetical protein
MVLGLAVDGNGMGNGSDILPTELYMKDRAKSMGFIVFAFRFLGSLRATFSHLSEAQDQGKIV